LILVGELKLLKLTTMISYVIGIGCSALLAGIVALFWVRGIDYMKENHPDYKGNDLFGYDEDDSDVDYMG